ncbi:MAG: hypothetical protein APF77_11230 [Clostridia bacterium BRH_c25]|nr:MAG: hypothetical protein APF77_11230 [Clostridia bacterium BRH_c25]
MSRKIFLIVLSAVMILSLTACVMEFDNAGSIISGALKEYKETVDLSDKYQGGQTMKLDLDMKLAKAVVSSTDDKLADVEFAYSAEVLRPEFTVKDDEISIKNRLERFSFGKPVNKWDVKLTDKLPFDVRLRADASDIRLDMGGMMVDSMDAKLSASSAKLYFDEPNKETLDKFKLDAAASSVDIYGAGNIDFEVMDIDADASKITVDLTGKNKRDGEVRINADASTVKLKLPENVGIRIVMDKYEISSVRINNSEILSRSDKEYVSKNYEDTERTLKIYADLNVTTLTIE